MLLLEEYGKVPRFYFTCHEPIFPWARGNYATLAKVTDWKGVTTNRETFTYLVISILGEAYFKAVDNPLLYFQVLMLSAQFEAVSKTLFVCENRP